MGAEIKWPHAPPHYRGVSGAYMVTAGTYQKEHYFASRKRLRFLCNLMLDLMEQYGWRPQAWAALSNHYHFVGLSPKDGTQRLAEMLSHIHRESAIFVNKLDGVAGRKVWHNYWDSQITYTASYFARLKYVHENPVHHGLVSHAEQYDWCSARWFSKNSSSAMVKTVSSFKTDRISIADDF